MNFGFITLKSARISVDEGLAAPNPSGIGDACTRNSAKCVKKEGQLAQQLLQSGPSVTFYMLPSCEALRGYTFNLASLCGLNSGCHRRGKQGCNLQLCYSCRGTGLGLASFARLTARPLREVLGANVLEKDHETGVSKVESHQVQSRDASKAKEAIILETS